MVRSTRAATAARQASTTTRSPRTKKEEHSQPSIKEEDSSPQKPRTTGRKRAVSSPEPKQNKKVKTEKIKEEEDTGLLSPSTSDSDTKDPKKNTGAKSQKPKDKNASSDLKSKKLKAYSQYASKSPFPDFPHPTVEECKLAHSILSKLHGVKERPKEVVASTTHAGCGDSPSVLDALVRTILSQNTSDANSTRAKQSMDKVYGRSDKWDAIAEGGLEKLQEAIKCGGLSVVKSKVIMSILNQTYEKYGKYSLDHLHEASAEDAMTEMLSFQGVGPKTASCVSLFCLQHESFAVDTHVYRITGLLGWRPKSANREETYSHLDVMIPDEDKYGLHILLVSHGKKCDECKAGGKSVGNCELRKAFRKGKLEGEAGDEVKEEEKKVIKKEKKEKK